MSKLAQFGPGFSPPTQAYNQGSAQDQALSNLELFISNALGILTVVAGFFFILYFVLGAFKWVTAGGDSGKVQKARDEMVQGVLGMIVIVAAYSIIGVLGALFGLDILHPATVLETLIPTGN